MTEAEMVAILMQGADRVAALPKEEQERALEVVRKRSSQAAVEIGLSPQQGARFADDLIEALRATLSPGKERHVRPALH